MLVSKALELFIRSRRDMRLAETTIRFYLQRLRPFETWFGDRELTDVTQIEVVEYLSVTGEKHSDSTRRHAVVVVETFEKFCLKHKLIKADQRFAEDLDKPPMGRREMLPTLEQTAALLKDAPKSFSQIYTGMRLCGSRPGEICRATIADWRRADRKIVLTVHKTARKTGRAREIPVSDELAALLQETTAGRSEGPLFLTTRGKPWTPAHLSKTYLRQRVKAGLPEGLVLYAARHEVATEICRKKGIEVCRRVLGHASTSTTQRYVHLNTAELADACNDLWGSAPKPPGPAPTDNSPLKTDQTPESGDQNAGRTDTDRPERAVPGEG